MKISKYIISLFAILLPLSCSDFLTEPPTTSLSESVVYSTEEALEAGITGCYATMQAGNGAWQKCLTQFLSACSGLVTWGGARMTAENWSQTRLLTMLPQNSANSDLFDHFYQSIYKCNKMIENLADSPVDQKFKNEIEAEARLIRAIDYFTLVRIYGDVPLIINTAKNAAETEYPRASYMKVYKQVLEDLNFAEEHMRTPERQIEVSGIDGRPHKWAATSFKASVYTQIACLLENQEYQFFDLSKEGRAPDFSDIDINTAEDAWHLALDAARSVIESGAYQLEPDFANLFAWGPDNPSIYQSKERIFVLQSTNNAGNQYLPMRTLPPYVQGTANVTAKNTVAGMVRPARYVMVKSYRVHLGSKFTERPDQYTQVPRTWSDPRVNLTYFHTSYKSQENGTVRTVRIYPMHAANENLVGQWSDPMFNPNQYEPYYKKYIDTHFDVTSGYADFYIMRYAEVFLLAAEAAASLSKGPGDDYWEEALRWMDFVHARARQSGGRLSNPTTRPSMAQWNATTKEALVDAIMWERVFEMHGEGHEFFDTHRRGGKWMSEWLTKPLNEFLKEPEQNNNYYEVMYENWEFEEDPQELRKAILLAFPEKEMRTNPAIGMNGTNDFYYETFPK